MKKPDLKTQILTDLADLKATKEKLKALEEKKKGWEETLNPIILKICQDYEKAWGYEKATEITSINLDFLPEVEYEGCSSENSFDGHWDLDFIFDEKAQQKEWKEANKKRLKAEKLKADETLAKAKKKAAALRKELEKLESQQNLKRNFKEQTA